MGILAESVMWSTLGWMAYLGLVARPKYLGVLFSYLGHETYDEMRKWGTRMFILVVVVTSAFAAFGGAHPSGWWERTLAFESGVLIGYLLLLLLPETAWIRAKR